MREDSLIRKVKKLTEEYSFSQPFSIYLKEHFRSHPEMGGRDRRETRGWCFNLLRIGTNLPDRPFESRLSVANFLCSDTIYPSISYLLKQYSELKETDLEKPLKYKLEIVKEKFPEFNLDNIFQMAEHLSPEIKREEWFLSFLKKPKVWIRMQKVFIKMVVDEMKAKGIPFTADSNPQILSFPPDVALEKTTSYQNGFFEIQDISSQRTSELFQSHPGENWWDACAGAGGKSLLLKEENPDIRLMATDNRATILGNYSERMKKAGYKFFETKVADLFSHSIDVPDNGYDGILADVPCSGSGTWSRSPEWLLKNSSNQVSGHYVPLQRKIVSSVLPALKAGSPIIFITCSVFKEENEENVDYFVNHFPLRLEKSAYLSGYEIGGDTLFVSRMVKLS